MDYQEYQETTDRILKMALRKRNLALALKCTESKHKAYLAHQAKQVNKPLDINDLSMETIDQLIAGLENFPPENPYQYKSSQQTRPGPKVNPASRQTKSSHNQAAYETKAAKQTYENSCAIEMHPTPEIDIDPASPAVTQHLSLEQLDYIVHKLKIECDNATPEFEQAMVKRLLWPDKPPP